MARPTQTLSDETSAIDGPRPVPAALLIASGGQPRLRVIPLRGGRTVLGRELDRPGGALELDDSRASREHAEVRWHAGAWQVRDLASHNGTHVNGRRVVGEVSAGDGAIVRIGHSLFWLLADATGYADDATGNDDGVILGPRLRAAAAAVRRAATAATLLILGDTGTGKERLARTYHQAGPRSGGPFVAVNCAAIPETVAERLLFGARKGAYSGAEDAPGYVQAAHRGTLFLDELAELPPALQAKLLRVLESREVWPVGASRGIPVELGVVAATHRDLRRGVADGRFREDLYFRLTKPVVHVPPLRERRDEIPALAALAATAVDPTLTLHPRLLEPLCTRPWPGNVRELLHEVRAAAEAARAAGSQVVRTEHLASDAGLAFATDDDDGGRDGVAVARAPAKATGSPGREDLELAIERAAGNLSAAARALGLHRTQLYRLLDRHGIARPPG